MAAITWSRTSWRPSRLKAPRWKRPSRASRASAPVAYTSGDPVALAKALSTWVKDNAEFTFKLGIVDGKVINVQEIQSLATLPGKEELFSKLLFLINAPATRLATVINATGRNLAVVVNQAVEQNKLQGGSAQAGKSAPEAPKAEASSEPASGDAAKVEAAHAAESQAGEQPSGAAQPENLDRIAERRGRWRGPGGRLTSFAVLSSGCAGLGATETQG